MVCWMCITVVTCYRQHNAYHIVVQNKMSILVPFTSISIV